MEESACHIPAPYRYFGLCCGILLSLLCVCGVLGNLLSIYVFSPCQNRSSAVSSLLCVLSIADCLLLLLAPPVYLLPPFWTFLCEVELPFIVSMYNVGLLYIYPVTLICQASSVWLLVCATLEQWVSVRWRGLHKNYFNRTGTSVMIISILLLAILFNLSAFWELEVSADGGLSPKLKSSTSYVLWKNTVADLSLCIIAPLLALIVLNTLVYRQIVLPRRGMSKTEKAATTRMLLYVVLMFILCYSLSLILMLLELVQPHWFLSNLGAAVSDFSNVLAALNSSTSALFYLIFSNRYRKTAAKLFCGLCGRAEQTAVTSEYSIRMLSRSDVSARRMAHARLDLVMRECQ